MFVDYLTVMLINLVAGLVLLASFVALGLDAADQKKWVPGFAMTGIVALVTGLHMVLNWPLPGSYNIAYGELTVLFGILFLGAALALAQGWDLLSVTIYALFAGLAAATVGVRLISLGLTKQPVVSGLGFILAGLGGVLALPAHLLRTKRLIRVAGVLVLLGAAVIFAITGYPAIWGHMESFSGWAPMTAR